MSAGEEPATTVIVAPEAEQATVVIQTALTEAFPDAGSAPTAHLVAVTRGVGGAGAEEATELITTGDPTVIIAEPATELIIPAETEPATELITAADTEPATELIIAAGTEPATELITAAAAEPATELITAADTELITPTDSEPATEPITAAKGDPGPADEPGAEDEPGAADEPEAGVATAAGPAVLAMPLMSGSDRNPSDEPVSRDLPVQKPVRQRRDQRAAGDRRRADPEQILASYPWNFDPQTLREQVDDPDRLWDLSDRLTDRLEFAERNNVRAGLLGLRAVVSRVLGELDEALADGREALRHAEASGELRPISIAQARLAQVLQWRGEFAEADELYARADSLELPSRTRAEILELAGRSAFEQGRYLEAVNHFERALDVRQGGDPELVERIELALDTISKRTEDGGWGPYPRTREELLGRPATPMPLRDDGTGLWGYAAAVEPRYAEVQPFTEGVAWVRRPDATAWELIDPAGAVVIGADAGYLVARPFAEGLAWVSRDTQGGQVAIDRENRTVVPGGFEDARPFRHGLALIRQGGVWGAVDRDGRVAVPPRYPAFATTLHTGGDVDGFTGEGLAVVDAGDGLLGVLDRTGRIVVEPGYRAVVIHPSAFLVADEAGRWGALTRAGEPLADLTHPDRAAAAAAVVEEARPVL
ncbi:WG repeat-containing protein [Actinoplanes sp. DH11]|uniref:WG repeat-containing protein n=1 Tax=Actinoplanes sp. DH11 TaxID=2857011 RepID=UPI001E40D970|nr:WG repeat-containing protein [Actinoplanes sp. DH11]